MTVSSPTPIIQLGHASTSHIQTNTIHTSPSKSTVIHPLPSTTTNHPNLLHQLPNHNLLPNKGQPPKKYPKSPSIPKTTRQSHNNQYLHFYPNQIDHIKPQLVRSKHKKGRSMDFEVSGFPMMDILENKIKCSSKGKMRINEKSIQQMRKRGTVSELKSYKQRSPEIRVEKNSNKSKNKKVKQQKNGNLCKKQRQKQSQRSQSNHEPDRYKQHLNSMFLLSKPSNQIPSFNSNILLKKQYHSMDLTSRRCKSSLRDKVKDKTQCQYQQLNNGLPFPSKVNSLYSNTSSIFCSKSQLQPVTQFNSVRVETEQVQQTNEIRKYESLALEKQVIKIIHSQPDNIDKPDDTNNIINRYLTLFQTQMERINQKSEPSIVLDLYQFSKDKKDSLLQNQFVSKQLQKQQTDSQPSKLDELINIISSTDALGQQNREVILTKIRQIIPIGLIGSTQFTHPEKEKHSQNNLSSGISSSVKQSWEKDDQTLFNIKELDGILTQREKQLNSKLEKEVQKIECSGLSGKEKRQQIQKITKWVSLQIQESIKTRVQLWKGFNLAKQLLGTDFDHLQPQGEIQRCASDNVLLTTQRKFSKKSTQKDAIMVQDNSEERLLSNTSQKDQTDPTTPTNPLLTQMKVNEPHLQPQPWLQQRSTLEQRLFSNKKYYSHSNQSSDNTVRNIVLIESAQRIEYDYQDDSPSSQQTPKEPVKKRMMCQAAEDQTQQYDELDQQFNLISPPPRMEIEDLNSGTYAKDDDKQDVFEFIFIDLCLQLVHQFRQGHRVLRDIERTIDKRKRQSMKRKGFKNDLQSIREYIMQFMTFITSRPALFQQVSQQIQKAMGPSPLQILSYIRPQQPNHNQDIPNILNPRLFQRYDVFFLDNMELQDYYDDQDLERKRRMFVKNASHIHNKAIFDAMNQSLDQKRPYGQWGEPFSWSTAARFKHPHTSTKKLIIESMGQVLVDCQFYCGYIPDKECLTLSSRLSGQQLQRNARRLCTQESIELQDLQQKLQFIEDDRTELLVLTSEAVIAQLVEEIALFFIL